MKILKKKCGGVRKDLNEKLPIELRYLFRNRYIECIQILIILFLNIRKSSGIELEELIYYNTLLNCSSMLENEEYSIDYEYIQNNYLTTENRIRKNILILVNKNLINISVKKNNKKNLLYLKANEDVKTIIKELKNEYFSEQLAKCKYLIKNMKFSTKNQKGVLMQNES